MTDEVLQAIFAILHRIAVVRIIILINLQNVWKVKLLHQTKFSVEPLSFLVIDVFLQLLSREGNAIVGVDELMNDGVCTFSNELERGITRAAKCYRVPVNM